MDTPVTHGISTTPYVTSLVNCAPGTEAYQRLGREIVLRSIDLKVNVTSQATSDVPQTCRVMITIDRDARGAVPNFSDIIESGVLMGNYELNNRKRFLTIFDDYLDLPPYSQGGFKTILFKKPLFLQTIFNAGDAGTIADVQENSIVLSMIGSETAVGGKYATLQGTCRIRFTDE